MPLLTTHTIPPGGWIYVQKNADGSILRRFKSMGPYDAFCNDVLSVRIANLIPGAVLAVVQSDVQAFTCERLGNDPRVCGPGSGPVAMSAGAVYVGGQPGCAFCGGQKT